MKLKNVTDESEELKREVLGAQNKVLGKYYITLIHMFTHIHIYTYTHIHIYTPPLPLTYTHTHIHTHTY
jgi:hypothetical protein